MRERGSPAKRQEDPLALPLRDCAADHGTTHAADRPLNLRSHLRLAKSRSHTRFYLSHPSRPPHHPRHSFASVETSKTTSKVRLAVTTSFHDLPPQSTSARTRCPVTANRALPAAFDASAAHRKSLRTQRNP
ncbi:hypothetical protein CBOM_08135 [Ceraceosorus bombacis]|uniref:Uncharacterized protein n=1 Tax=Ceraceosorus bombacis TaxID=401625 RepID=A0A0P1B889_9BASI|nr:hypothetical protein CBOM_08135 [Ceraceosorus bombacis]